MENKLSIIPQVQSTLPYARAAASPDLECGVVENLDKAEETPTNREQ